MTDLRERCENLYASIYGHAPFYEGLNTPGRMMKLEAFARECERDGYRRGVEEAANVFSEWYGLPRVLMLEKIRALLSKGEG